jgi:hypothetical protein
LDATASGTNLTQILLETIAEPAVGNLFGSLSAGGFGADGNGYVKTIMIDGITYTYNVQSDTVTNSANATVITGSSFTVSTALNGSLTIDMKDGAYVYTPDATLVNPITESFNFTLQDRDGDISSGTVNLNVSRDFGDVPAIVTPLTLSVSEEGLVGGAPDTIGSPDTTNNASATGSLSFVDADSSTFTLVLDGPAGITSGGESVVWTWSAATNTLTGSTATGTEVMTVALGSVASNGANHTVSYTTVLKAPIDHPNTTIEDALNLSFDVSISDGRNTSQSTINISVEDDAPIPAVPYTADLAMVDTNLMIVLDVSGSMNTNDGINGQTRLQSAIASIKTLLDRYDEFGNVKVSLVSFNAGSSVLNSGGTVWMSIAQAKTVLDGLSAGGNTNYDLALNSAINAFNTAGKIANAQNLSYFFSDGAPTAGNGGTGSLTGGSSGSADYGIQAAEELIWTNFLNANQIKSYAIGIGSGLTNVTQLNPIAYDGQASVNIGGTLVTSFDDLDDVLAGTILNPVGGQLIQGTALQAESLGADGGVVKSITINGVTYTYNEAANTVTTSGGTNQGVFVAATSVLTVTTINGGKFVVDMNDGDYSYVAPDSISASIIERMNYVLTDNDGDTTSSYVDVDVARMNVQLGTTGNDTLNGTSAPDMILGRDGNDIIFGFGGNDRILGGSGVDTIDGGTGNDLINGGLGNDILTGGDGDDTFLFYQPQGNDTIKDFHVYQNPGDQRDVLDLSDLLVNESANTLDSYLHFSQSGNNTIVHIKSTGGINGTGSNADQLITLEGVTNLGAGVQTDAEIIQQLLSNNQLITD